jgi:RNA polymerase-binding transcription factor
MSPKDDEIRTRLFALKEELTSLSAISEEARATVALDQQSVGRLSRMDAMQMQAMAQASERQRSQDLLRIEAALHRLAQGDYGACLECGEDIPAKRLAVDPAATLCITCAAGKEL